jgi:thymidylate synthase (FAD)
LAAMSALFFILRGFMTSFNIQDYFGTINVLDKGYVELMDGMVCDPKLKIVNSARVSFLKAVTELSDRDLKLIQFMKDHGHYSVFRHSYFTFRWKAPLSVFRQAWKYQIASEWIENENVGVIEVPETNWNEASGRYIEFVPEFYIPVEMRGQSKINKQGSDGVIDTVTTYELWEYGYTEKKDTPATTFFEESCQEAYRRYKAMIDSGIAKEQARMILPQNIYSECMWTISLQGLMFFFEQRLKPDAQWEIRQYATAIHNLIMPMFDPIKLYDELSDA